MTTLGMPTSMFLIFVATILAGSLGAIHYVIVHVILGKPFSDEEHAIGRRDPAEPTTSPGQAARSSLKGAAPESPGRVPERDANGKDDDLGGTDSRGGRDG